MLNPGSPATIEFSLQPLEYFLASEHAWNKHRHDAADWNRYITDPIKSAIEDEGANPETIFDFVTWLRYRIKNDPQGSEQQLRQIEDLLARAEERIAIAQQAVDAE